MEHIVNPSFAGIDFETYSAYVESIRHALPPHVYAFASDIRYFDFQSHSSLHDSWLEALTVSEPASGKRHEVRRLEIHICLLGPCHDLRIHLHYTGVTWYRFEAPPHYGNDRFEKSVAHGDLLTHEIRLGHEGRLLHEILFERDATLLIECADIRHSEELISGAEGR